MFGFGNGNNQQGGNNQGGYNQGGYNQGGYNQGGGRGSGNPGGAGKFLPVILIIGAIASFRYGIFDNLMSSIGGTLSTLIVVGIVISMFLGGGKKGGGGGNQGGGGYNQGGQGGNQNYNNRRY